MVEKHSLWLVQFEKVLYRLNFCWFSICFHLEQALSLVEYDYHRCVHIFLDSLVVVERLSSFWTYLVSPLNYFKGRFSQIQQKKTNNVDDKLLALQYFEKALPLSKNCPWLKAKILKSFDRLDSTNAGHQSSKLLFSLISFVLFFLCLKSLLFN